jgi:hypothetical protein
MVEAGAFGWALNKRTRAICSCQHYWFRLRNMETES